MRILKLWLDGYGRFSGRSIALAPGLQVVAGPNEQGKTTLRNFIGDMLYGQKASPTQRRYEDGQDLRRPWQNPGCYAGRLLYCLDDGREIEVHRNFDRKQETVQVFDRTHAKEITGGFRKLGNREPLFAEEHLGLSKAVFLNTATIGHMALENLGDDDALAQIREKILSLADSAEDTGTAESALRYLAERIAGIGRPDRHSKRPLPVAMNRMKELRDEYDEANALREETARIEQRRAVLQREVEGLRKRRAELGEELEACEHADRAARLRKAEAIEQEIAESTQKCFLLSSVREFPVGQAPEVNRAANAVATVRNAIERTEEELAREKAQLEEELAALGDSADAPAQEIPEDYDQRLSDLDREVKRLRDRLEELEKGRHETERRLAAAQADLAALPDFSRVSDNPLEWLNGLAGEFSALRGRREEQRAKRDALRERVHSLREVVAGPARLFSRFGNFVDDAARYDDGKRQFESDYARLREEAERLQRESRENRADRPKFMWVAVFGFLAFATFLPTFIYTRNYGFLWVDGICGFVFLYGFCNWIYARARANHADILRADLQKTMREAEEKQQAAAAAVEIAIQEAGYTTVRELEALYHKFSRDREELKTLEQDLALQQSVTEQSESELERFLEETRGQMALVRVRFSAEDEVAQAVKLGVTAYQVYRDAKRRVLDCREALTQATRQCESAKADVDMVEKKEVELSLEVRRMLRDAGYRDEGKVSSALRALSGYRLRRAQVQHKQGRVDRLREGVAALDRRLAAEREDLAKREESLQRLLREANAHSVEHWHELAGRANEYRRNWERRGALQQQLDTVLSGDDIKELRAAVAQGERLTPAPEKAPDRIKTEIDRVMEQMEEALIEEHTLHVQLARQTAGVRSLSEIEEERAAVERRLGELQLELEAASYAATVIEDVARDTHARIAPSLTKLASQYLAAITGERYNELLLSRDLCISVRIPQTDRLNDKPEQVLSKGTVDQVYLALRLALVHSMSNSTERAPLLLDDPFSNYDDDRLRNAMTLLARVGEEHQVLVFTCREDVVRAAQAVDAPVLYL